MFLKSFVTVIWKEGISTGLYTFPVHYNSIIKLHVTMITATKWVCIMVYLRRWGCSTCRSCAYVWAQRRACGSGSVCAGWRSWWPRVPGAAGWWGWQLRWAGEGDPLGRPRCPALTKSRWKPGSTGKTQMRFILLSPPTHLCLSVREQVWCKKDQDQKSDLGIFMKDF